jgi:2-polyprenyl-6-methoxyphenol hydroxylase-like FAD-dependent oxidoreductase
MQTVLLSAAEEAGATVRRGATVVGVSPGQTPSVRARDGDGEHTFHARLVVGADGRNSGCRNWAGFRVERDPERMAVAGVLFEALGAPEHMMSMFIDPSRGAFSLTIPLGRQKFRTYVGIFRQNGSRHLSGQRALPEFVETSIAAGAPLVWYEGAKAIGPLASFEGADSWVEHPYRDGVALVGDAAASNDPSFGCGLSLTLRDVRVLRDKLLAQDDWDAATMAPFIV